MTPCNRGSADPDEPPVNPFGSPATGVPAVPLTLFGSLRATVVQKRSVVVDHLQLVRGLRVRHANYVTAIASMCQGPSPVV